MTTQTGACSRSAGRHFTPGQYSLTEREREIAAIVITAKCTPIILRRAHEKHGREIGLSAVVVDAMTAGLPTSFDEPRAQTVCAVATSLADNRIVSRGLYGRAVSLLRHPGALDVITFVGYYTPAWLTMKVYAVPAGTRGIER